VSAPQPAPVAGADSLAEAKRMARQAIWQNARKLVMDLVEGSSTNYLAVKFLFEVAGLMDGDSDEESSVDFKSFMQDLLNRPKTGLAKQTSDAKLNLSSSNE
jgi:hypothetical protein